MPIYIVLLGRKVKADPQIPYQRASVFCEITVPSYRPFVPIENYNITLLSTRELQRQGYFCRVFARRMNSRSHILMSPHSTDRFWDIPNKTREPEILLQQSLVLIVKRPILCKLV
jgi:hypothetical protein